MTAGDVVDRIKKNIEVPWRDTTYRDTYKAGGPETPVTGIATTMFNSFDVIQLAVAAGLNMILPHETTFWNDRDEFTVVSADRIDYQATFEDAKVYTRPFTMALTFGRTVKGDDAKSFELLEEACHEGDRDTQEMQRQIK